MSGWLREAWGHLDDERAYLGARGYDPPHLVTWGPGTTTGPAMCGKRDLRPVRIDAFGMASRVGVRVCAACVKAAAAARPAAPVVDLAGHRRRRTGGWAR